MIKYHAGSPIETEKLGLRLGSILQKGDIVCLTGDLGTGKTAFTGGIAKALGVEDYITSPTFIIVNEYEGRMPLYHFDVYRIGSSDEMFDIGFDEYISGNGVVVIEWAELIMDILPEERINVTIEKDRMDMVDSRLITIEFSGTRLKEYERKLTDESAGN